MPGAYTRSKMSAEQRALEAAASGFPVVVASPTMPIGNDPNLTPPASMLQYFMNRRIQFYLDFVVNLVDVQDVADGLMLAMQRGRSGERYVLGGENISLKKLLAILGIISGRKAIRIPVSAGPAQMIAAAVEFIANHATHRPSKATVEGVAHRVLVEATVDRKIAPRTRLRSASHWAGIGTRHFIFHYPIPIRINDRRS
jgi:Nucleoside-diphosphate-sugar epimerases